MGVSMLIGTMELGLIYGILALGLFISFRILNVPDLTVDGSFVTGAAISAFFCKSGYPWLGLLAAFIGGGATGCLTALLHTKCKIQLLLSSIIMMLCLYSINLKLMSNQPNIPLLRYATLFGGMGNNTPSMYGRCALVAGLAFFVWLLLFLFFRTRAGYAIRATGNNEQMAVSSGISTSRYLLIGLALSNGIVAFSGALLSQYQKFADIGMGIGMIVVGLASVIIGEALFGSRYIWRSLLAVILGSILYRYIIAGALQLGMPPTDLKLVSGGIVILALSLPGLRASLMNWQYRFRSKPNEGEIKSC